MDKRYIVEEKYESLRIDKLLFLYDSSFSRSYYSNLIKNNEITVNGKPTCPSYKVKKDDVIGIILKEVELDPKLEPFEFKLDIIYEDDYILIINKPQGLVVHPGNGHQNDTLVNALIYNQKQLSKVNGLYRIGIVHRIDKDTSGLLLICKDDFTHNEIAKQLKTHSMHREYIALVDGIISCNEGKVIGKIGRDPNNRLKMAINNESGKEAVTHFKVLERFKKNTLIECTLETGRTHQIRVHMSSIGYPITGDTLYGGGNTLYQNGQLLHAYKLTFFHPILKKEMSFECDIPEYFKSVLNKLRQ